MRKRWPILTAQRVREVFDYDPITGMLRWRISPGRKTPAGTVAGWIDTYGYRVIQFEGKNHKGHHLAWAHVHGAWPADDVDHKDNCGDHNWIDNLRDATRSQNLANKRLEPNRNTSGFKGVSYKKAAKKYVAQITKNGHNIYLGLYVDPESAHAAYVAKAKELFGEFANSGC